MSAGTIDWIVPQVEDLNDYLAGRAIVSFRTKALATGQQDPYEPVMIDITNTIRLDIASCATNSISETPNSIPPSLKTIASLMIIEAMQGRLPGVNLTDKQADMLKDGKGRLKRIASCNAKVEAPTDPEDVPTVQQGGGPEVVKYRVPVFSCSLSEMP